MSLDLWERAQALLAGRRTAYVKTFKNPVGEEVLKDLVHFCRATETTFHADPRMHAVLEGRREVWLRIQNYSNLSDKELWEKYGKKKPAE